MTAVQTVVKREVSQNLRCYVVEANHNLTTTHFPARYVFPETMRYHEATSIAGDGTSVTEVSLHVETKEESGTVDARADWNGYPPSKQFVHDENVVEES